jgi:hypothetical protein
MAGMGNIVLATKRTRVINATAAGTTNINGTILDMLGFEGAVFEASIGTLSATQQTQLKAQGGNAANGSDMADLVGAVTPVMADGDSNKMLVLEVHRPIYRYLRCVLVRGTANAVIDSVTAFQYADRKQPESDDATTVSQTLVSIEPRYSSASFTQVTTVYAGSTTSISNTYRSAS